jgi:hypothetical protein
MTEDSTPRYFRLEEAIATLEIVRPLIAQIMEIRQEILARQPEVWPAMEKSAGNGGNKAASALVGDFERLQALVQAVQDTGAILKDVNTGLVDFLALRDGREVYLCWKYGEESISYWHDIDAGFAGRQPL